MPEPLNAEPASQSDAEMLREECMRYGLPVSLGALVRHLTANATHDHEVNLATIRLLRARLAAVEALADEWAGDPVGGDLWRSEAVDALRAALRSGGVETPAAPMAEPRVAARADTCAHGEPEGACPSCAACAACDGGCGVCPYARSSATGGDR